MANEVKCLYCGERFPREQGKKVNGNRYAHFECIKKEELKKGIVAQIHTKMQGLLGDKYNRTKIDRSIKSMVKDGKTEAGILRTLEYWYDVRGMSAEKANGGISIVDWVYGDAMNYYERQQRYKEQALTNEVRSDIETKTLKIKPTPIRKPKGIKLFKML